MKTTITVFFLAILCLQCSSQTTSTENNPQLVEKTEKIRDLLIRKDYDAIPADFNNQMIEALKPEQIKQVWEGLIKQIGDYESNGEITSDQTQEYRIVYSILKFEKAPFKLKVVYDGDDKVAGLFLIPINAK